MISVDFTRRPLIPMASAPTSSALCEHLGDGDLDAEVVDLVAVVREDDVDEVLADVVDVALDGGEARCRPRPPASARLHVGLEMGDGSLHGLGRLQHERQLHLPRAEEVADRPHPREQHVVHDVEGAVPGVERLVELVVEPVAVAVDDALLEPPLDRPAGAVLSRGCDGAACQLEVGDELGEGVVAVSAAPVVDEVEAELLLASRRCGKGEDLAGVHDGGVEAGLRCTRGGRRS